MSDTTAKPQVQAPQLRSTGKTPLFVLPSTAGGKSGPGALRSKSNVVLAFVDDSPGGEQYLGALAEAYADIQASQARVLVVVPFALETATSVAERLNLPFPLLADDGG